MTSYSIVLFIHVASALVLAAALGVDAVLLARLRRATTARDAESWLAMWRAVPWSASLSLLLLLLTGGYIAGRLGQWTLAWPTVAVFALVLMGALGGISSKRMRLARKACAADNADAECLQRLRDPMLKFSVNMRIALLVAAVLLMIATPGLYASSLIVVGGLIAGFLASLSGCTRRISPQGSETGTKSQV